MIVLGIETATDICSVGLSDDGDLVAEYRLKRGHTHAERLPEALERLVADCGLQLPDIDGLAVSIGPGSFTGLRIGLGMAKGLAYGLKKPLVAVPTMDGLLVAAPQDHAWACVLLHARKGEVYRGLFRMGNRGWCIQRPIDTVGEMEIVEDLPNESILFLGEGAILFRRTIEQKVLKSILSSSTLSIPSGFQVATRGIDLLNNGEEADLNALTPTYIKRFQGID